MSRGLGDVYKRQTLAGLVIHEAQMIPTVGQVFSFHGYRFEVVERKANRITSIKVIPI